MRIKIINKVVWKLPTSTQLRETWHTDSLDTVVLPSTGASRYHDCCINGVTSPEYFGFLSYDGVYSIIVSAYVRSTASNLRKYRRSDAIAGWHGVTSGGTHYPTQTLTYNGGTSGNKKQTRPTTWNGLLPWNRKWPEINTKIDRLLCCAARYSAVIKAKQPFINTNKKLWSWQNTDITTRYCHLAFAIRHDSFCSTLCAVTVLFNICVSVTRVYPTYYGLVPPSIQQFW
jgi:hypothetical protein